MGLLVIGFAVGLVVAFLLRTLLQYERDGLAQAIEGMNRLEESVLGLEERIEALETIAAADEEVVPPAPSSEASRPRSPVRA